MVTKNRKTQGYLRPIVYEALQAYKVTQGITSDSQAFDIILSEFLGIERPKPVLIDDAPETLPGKFQGLQNQFNGLAAELDRLKERVKELESNAHISKVLHKGIETNSDNALSNLEGALPEINAHRPVEDESVIQIPTHIESHSHEPRPCDGVNEELLDVTSGLPPSDNTIEEDQVHPPTSEDSQGDDGEIDQEPQEHTPEPATAAVTSSIEAEDITQIETKTKSQMARLLGVHPSTVGNWVKAKNFSKIPKAWKWNSVKEYFERVLP